MNFTVSFPIILLAVVAISFRARSREDRFVGFLTLAIALELNVITSSSATVLGQELNCSDVATAAAFAAAAALSIGHRLDRKLVAMAIVCLVIVAISTLSLVFFPYGGLGIPADVSWDSYYYYGQEALRPLAPGLRSILVFVRLAMFLFLTTVASEVLKPADYVRCARCIATFGKLHVAWASVELLTKVAFGSAIMPGLAQMILPSFSSITRAEVISRGDLSIVVGLTREPSHFAWAMIWFILVMLMLGWCGEGRRSDALWVCASAALLFLSGAFTSLYGVMVIGAMVAWRLLAVGRRLPPWAIAMLFGGMALAPLVLAAFSSLGPGAFGYYVDRLENVTRNLAALAGRNYGALSGSADSMPRLISIRECLGYFADRPLTGVGIGVVNAHGGILTVLACLGVLGTSAWLSFLMAFVSRTSGGNKSAVKGFVVLLIAVGLLSSDGGLLYYLPLVLFGGLVSRVAIVTELNNNQFVPLRQI